MSAAPAPPAKAPHVGLVIAGLMLGILLAALDQTVVATSLREVVEDIGGFERFSWLFSAYMLASTVVIPIAGKLSDIYGRRPVYLAGMGVFLLGSALCGTARTMDQLILYRAIQGLGGGAIFPVALASIADLFAPAERGRVGGAFGAVFGLSSVVGPFIGGGIVDYVHVAGIASWRWVFYVNVPVGVAAITMVALFFPRTATRKDVGIDWLGSVTLTLALVAGLLTAVLIQEDHAVTSPQVLGLAALALASLAAFIRVERRAKDPILPPALFRNPVFRVSVVASLLSGAAMFTIISFMPIYMQGVVGISATRAGTALIPLSLGIVAGASGSGQLMRRFGYKGFVLAGFALAVAGYLLLWDLTRDAGDASLALAVAEMALLGLGIGFTLQTLIIAVQNAVDKRFVGVTTSAVTLFRTLGATVGVTVLGLVLNARFSDAVRERAPPGAVEGALANVPELGGKVANLPNLLLLPHRGGPFIEAVKASYAEAMGVIFLVAAGIAAVAFGVSLFLKSIPMKTREEYHAPGLEP